MVDRYNIVNEDDTREAMRRTAEFMSRQPRKRKVVRK